MARIRTIKPEFWADEKLSVLSSIDRLVFLGLCSALADDTGRLLDNIKVIDAAIFPNSNESAAKSLDTLQRLERIRRGNTASGQGIIQIVNWAKHQKVDKPNLKGALPELVDTKPIRESVVNDSGGCREAIANNSRPIPTTNDHLPTTPDQGWTVVEKDLLSLGVKNTEKLRPAYKASPQKIVAIISTYQSLLLEIPNRWKDPPAVLHWRITEDTPGSEVSEKWPPPEQTSKRRASEAIKRNKKKVQAAKIEAELKQDAMRKQTLDNRYANDWQRLPEKDRQLIAERLLPAAEHQLIRRKPAMLRERVFFEAENQKINDLKSILAGGA